VKLDLQHESSSKNKELPAAADNRDGPIIDVVKVAIDWLGKWSSIACGFYRPRDYDSEAVARGYDRKMLLRVDLITVMWWALIGLSYPAIYLRIAILWEIGLTLVVLRIVNILAYSLRVALVDSPLPRRSYKLRIVSARRSLVFGMTNFLELVWCFGCIYAVLPHGVALVTGKSLDWVSYLYFSCMTQLTVGYGDIVPVGWMRVMASIQALNGLLLITVIIARFVAMLRIEEQPAMPPNAM
jgi:hypothetical protein